MVVAIWVFLLTHPAQLNSVLGRMISILMASHIWISDLQCPFTKGIVLGLGIEEVKHLCRKGHLSLGKRVSQEW